MQEEVYWPAQKAAPAGWGRDPPPSRHTRLRYLPMLRGSCWSSTSLGIEVKVSPLASVFLQSTPGVQLACRDQGPEVPGDSRLLEVVSALRDFAGQA